MARTFYSVVFCLALAMLATMWLKPGVAQDLIDMARRVRMQSPDPIAGAPQYSLPGNLPGSNMPGAPVQPMPATRPVGWPGTPASSYNPPPSQYGAQAGPINNSVPGAGVTVWDPSGNRMAAAPGNPNGPANPNGQANSSGPQNPTAQGNPTAPSYPTTQYPTTQYPAPQYPTAPPSGYPTNYPGQAYPDPSTAQPVNPQMASPNTVPQTAPLDNQTQPAPNPDMQNLQVLPAKPQDLTAAKVLAKCGNEVILTGDCDILIAAVLAKQKMDVPPDQKEEVYTTLRRQVLKQMIEQKLIYADAVKSVPAAGITKIEANLNDKFDKEQLPEMMKSLGVTSRQELDDKLKARGSSIDRERRAYFERMLSMGWMQEKIKTDVEIPLSDILGYYEQHLDDYKFKAQAKWEELMVSFDKFPDKASAYAAIAQMGNQVMQGAPLADVAKAGSQGPTASDGGAYDWTTEGSLAAKEIDRALFGLPVGGMSQIIESNRGFHIVRVVDRKAAGKKSFEDAQADIKKQLKKDNMGKQIEKYMSELKKKTPVWTAFDNQPGGLEGPKQPESHPNFEQ